MKKNEIAGIITSKSDIQTSLRLLIHHQPPNAFKPISRCLHIKETFKQSLAFYFEATLRQFYLQKNYVITCLLLLLKHLTFYCVIVLVSSKSCSGEKSESG